MIHFWVAALKSDLNLRILILETILFILLNPFIPSLCFFLFLSFRLSGNAAAEKHAHFLAKTMAVINGTFEVQRRLRIHPHFLISGANAANTCFLVLNDGKGDTTLGKVSRNL